MDGSILGIFTNPWVIIPVLLIPLVVIGMAKTWKRIKDKKAEAAGSATPPSSQP